MEALTHIIAMCIGIGAGALIVIKARREPGVDLSEYEAQRRRSLFRVIDGGKAA